MEPVPVNVRHIIGLFKNRASSCLEVADVLDRIARSGVTIKGGSRELLRKLTLLNVFEKRGVVEDSQNQVLGKLGLHDPLLNQLLEDAEIWGCTVLGVTLCSRRPVLKGGDLSL